MCTAFPFPGATVPGRLIVTVVCCNASGSLQPLQATYLVCGFKQAWVWLDVCQFSIRAMVGSGPNISLIKGGLLHPSLKCLVHACFGTFGTSQSVCLHLQQLVHCVVFQGKMPVVEGIFRKAPSFSAGSPEELHCTRLFCSKCYT